jgi:hypothetical protein
MWVEGVAVSTRAIWNAIYHPLKIVSAGSEGYLKVVGKDAAFVMRPDGKIVTVWARSRAGFRLGR